MPVEQLAGIVDATTDLYALGMSLLHLATRVEPWQIDRRVAAKANLSRRFRAFVDRLTAREPAQRFPTAAAALHALDAPTSRPAPFRPVLAIVAIGGACGAFGAWTALRTEPTPEPDGIATVRVKLPTHVVAQLFVDDGPLPIYPAVVDGQRLAIATGRHRVRLQAPSGSCEVSLVVDAGATLACELPSPPAAPAVPPACASYFRAIDDALRCDAVEPATREALRQGRDGFQRGFAAWRALDGATRRQAFITAADACREAAPSIRAMLASNRCGSAIDVDELRARADRQYRDGQFTVAAATLRDALPELTDRDAAGLRTIALEYETVGAALATTEPASSAYAQLSVALAYDRAVGAVYEAAIRDRLVQLAPTAAMMFFANGAYESAYQAVVVARTSGSGKPTADAVRVALERKAAAIYDAAAADLVAHPDAARAQLRRIRLMVDTYAPIAAKAKALLGD